MVDSGVSEDVEGGVLVVCVLLSSNGVLETGFVVTLRAVDISTCE